MEEKAKVPYLKMNDISKSYSGVKVLDKVNAEIDTGQILALIGENGAGKSTLIKILSGAERPDGGDIYINGTKVDITNPLSAVKLKIVTVYQEFSLFPDLTVAENLFFGDYSRNKGKVNWKKIQQEATKILNSFNMNIDVNQPVSSLSVAEKQTLEIAKALCQDVSILILDEPTAVLGEDDAKNFLNTIKLLREKNVAVIFISHRLKEIFGFADKYLVMRDGLVVETGNVDDTNHDSIVEKMVGRVIEKKTPEKISYNEASKVLQVEDLSYKDVLSHINFSLYRGEILGFAGLRGAGRTELARAIFGVEPPSCGKVTFNGENGINSSPRKAIINRYAMIPEERKTQSIFENMSVETNMFMAYSDQKWINYKAEHEKAKEYIESLRIKAPSLSMSIGELSGGNQQKVVLAKWLETGADIFILDEPTRGIDIGAKAQIYSIVRELCKQGKSVILISSELPELIENCHRILVLHLGEIVGEISHDVATEEKIMKLAVGGELLS